MFSRLFAFGSNRATALFQATTWPAPPGQMFGSDEDESPFSSY
jgi:hypothetical protein